MRTVSTTFCILILLLATQSEAGIFSTKVEMVVKIIDDNQKPVEGARVTGSFRQYPSNIEIKCVTDKEGVCVIKGRTSNDGAIQVNKEGYYYSSMPFEFKEINKKLNRYEPWGNTYQVVLKKKRNPVPMYAKSFRSIDVPILDTPVGFDLEVGDWVEPYGKGVVNDFVFLMKSVQAEWTEYNCSYTLTFTNEFDGIQEYLFYNEGTSYYKWPYNAPESNYKKEIVRTKSDSRKGGFQTTEKKENNYIFRVRTEVDEKGNVIDARYGKILGEIRLFPKALQFTYYFNPDGTPNLEFDPEQNLFKFNRREKRKHRVQRP